MRLVDDWKQAHKWACVRVSAFMAALFGIGPSLLSAWGMLPDDLKAQLPQGWGRVIAVVGFLLVMGSRIVHFDSGGQDAAQ